MSKSRDIADSAATINYIDNVTSDVQSQINTLDTAIDNISVTNGSLTKTFAAGESSTLTLSSGVLVPNVSVTKEIPQTGVSNNAWDAAAGSYTLEDSAYATSLSFVGGNLNNATLVNSFGVAANTTTPTTIRFNDDGTIMYTSSQSVVYQYALSTAFDISTASYSSKSLDFSAQGTDGYGGLFNNDGTLFYIVDRVNDTVYQYSLSTAWDISTASYASKSFSFASQETDPRSISFNDDGTKMFVVGQSSDSVLQYSLSSAYDVSTASYDSLSFSIASQEPSPTGLVFSSTGLTFYITGFGTDSIYKYTLSTAWDISTASYTGQSLDISAEEAAPLSITLDNTNFKIYIGGNGSDAILQYNPDFSLALGTGSFASTDVGKTINVNDGVLILTATDGSYVESTAPSSTDAAASGEWSMFGVVYDATDDVLEVSNYNNTFNIADASYDSATFSVSAQMANCYGVRFSSDGTKMYVAESTREINQYNLSTPFVVSSASYASTYTVNQGSSSYFDFCFNNDGTILYALGYIDQTIYQYILSTPWSISTASYASKSYTASFSSGSVSININPDGTKMFIGRVGTFVGLHEIDLSIAYDVSTASYNSVEFRPTGLGNVYSYAFNKAGTKLFAFSNTNQTIHQYSLGTAFSISSVTDDSISFSLSGLNIFYFCFNDIGNKLYFSGTTADSIYQYSSGEIPIFATGYQPCISSNIDSTYWTDINSLTATNAIGDGNVFYAISNDARDSWSVLDNTDGVRDIVRNNAGTWQYNSNGTYTLETWANASTNTEVAALREAMEGAVGDSVVDPFDVSTSVYSQSFSVASQAALPLGMAFSPDGTEMFITDETTKSVFQYTLSTGFDVSTASYTRSFSIGSRENFPQGIAFNTDGTKMFIIGWEGDDVNEFTLSTAFNISTASYTRVFSVSAQSTFPQDLVFNADGTKMFVIDGTNDSVFQYNLSTGFNVSTASYASKSFSVSGQETSPRGIRFNTDGTKMFVIGDAGQDVNEYTLSTSFDVSTASFVDSFSVSAQETFPAALAFNATGNKMFIVGGANDTVFEYSVGTSTYTNQMDSTKLNAITDANQITLGDDLDFAAILYYNTGSTVPTYSGTAINYDANILNQGAVLGTDYNFDAPASDKVRITAVGAGNYKVRVV